MPMERGVSELQQLGKITGLIDIKTEQTLEITPSITLSENGERVEDPNDSAEYFAFCKSPDQKQNSVSA